MTIHYHGTPITPKEKLLKLAGKHFCVSFAHPEQVRICHEIGQSVMLDNGAFSFWKSGKQTDWKGYYEWVEAWLKFHTTWAVIPDVIDGSEKENNDLIRQWPHGPEQAAPVWHLHESLQRLQWLCSLYPRICFGSSGQYATIGNSRWHHRIIEAFNAICYKDRPIRWIHMLRGMSLSGSCYPFASVDSTDVARNHARSGDIFQHAQRWDRVQCPSKWIIHPEQTDCLRLDDEARELQSLPLSED